MNMVESIMRQLEQAEQQVELLAEHVEQLDEQNATLVEAIKQTFNDNIRLEEDIAELNTVHGDSPIKLPTAIPLVATVDSIIGRVLENMDSMEGAKHLTVRDVLDIYNLRTQWLADK